MYSGPLAYFLISNGLAIYMHRLPTLMNRKFVDEFAVEFCMTMNTKANRKKLARALFNVDKNRWVELKALCTAREKRACKVYMYMYICIMYMYICVSSIVIPYQEYRLHVVTSLLLPIYSVSICNVSNTILNNSNYPWV